MTRSQYYISLSLILILALSFSSNPPQGRTGGPGEQTCAAIGCHSGVNVTIGGHVELFGLPDQIIPDSTYRLSFNLIIDRGVPLRGGFQMTALTSDEKNVGGFINPGESSTISESNGRHYFEHDPAKRFDGADTLSYPFDWSIDSQFETDSIMFYAAANFANGDGGSSGDRIVTWADTFYTHSNGFNLTSTVIEASCPDVSDGSISISVSGGTPPFNYQWSTGDSTEQIGGLQAGTYSVTVTDQNLISDSLTTILTIRNDTMSPVFNCLRDTLIISSCAPFSYPRPSAIDNCGVTEVTRISGQGPNTSFSPGIHPEIYEAIDLAGNKSQCTIFIKNINVIQADFTIQHLACFKDSTGSVSITISGDNGPYDIRVISDNSDLEALPEGMHTILITDNSGCELEEIIEIKRPDSLSLTITKIGQPLSTDSGDGSIEVQLNGGSPPYSYLWKTEDEDFSEDQNLRLLFPGKYVLTAMDTRGCSIQSDTIILDAITSIINPEVSQAIRIAPNPVDHQLRISFTDLSMIKSMRIIDLKGRRRNHWFGNSKILNISHLEEGQFLLVIELEDGRHGLQSFIKI